MREGWRQMKEPPLEVRLAESSTRAIGYPSGEMQSLALEEGK